jgi:nucleoside-diphosphate-sugar epimerase
VILVTGGAGFIGSHIVDACLARGHHVRVLDDFSTGSHENLAHCAADVEIIEGDVRDAGVVTRAMTGAEAVFHEAAIPSVSRSFEEPALVEAVNVGGTVAVLDAAQRFGVRQVVLASSCAVYGSSSDLPLAEDVPAAPLSPYAVGKLACEEFARVLDAAAICLRYFNVYGPRQDPSSEYSGVIARFMDHCAAGRDLVVDGDGSQTRDFVYVGDVVAANLLALDAPARAAVVNVGSGRQTSIAELATAVCNVSGAPVGTRVGPRRVGDVDRSCASLARAADVLRYAPAVDLEDGLRTTWQWYAGR